MMQSKEAPVARKASTVMVLRPASLGLEVFMIQRNRKTGFMPNAWVFPGGRVDPEDSDVTLPLVGGRDACERMRLTTMEGTPFLVAAVRETFEETGIWLGDKELTEERREALMSGTEAFRQVLLNSDVSADLDRLHPWSWWVTPKIEPRRYDTRFFVAFTDMNTSGLHDEREAVNHRWIAPHEALVLAEKGSFPLAPPTWWTLHELNELGDISAVRAALTQRSSRAIQPILATNDNGDWELKLPGHPEHPEPSIPNLPHAVRFAQGRWWAK